MSWPAKARRLAAGVSALCAAAALGGCGFTPLYATPAVGSGLSAIKVNAPYGRIGFLLGEDLDDAFARDRDKPAIYRLDITLLDKRYPRGLRVDNTADRYETHLIVYYQLIEIDNSKVIKSGSEPVEVSYAASGEPYADVSAQLDAQQRAANLAAEQIRINLGEYFASQPDH